MMLLIIYFYLYIQKYEFYYIKMITIEDLPLTGFNTASKIINSQAITVWVSQDFFYIEPNYKKSFIPTILKINRKTQLI